MMVSLLCHLYLLLLITNSAPLKIESCCHLKSIDALWNPLNQGTFYFDLTVNNDPSTLQRSISFNEPDGLSKTNIDSTFCWEYDSTNISITTFKPYSALNIQIRMRNSTQPLNAITSFKHPQIIKYSEPSFDNKTINSINFNLYHKIKMTNTLLKISNRNFIIKRNCFQLYSICFYEIDKSDPNCLNIDSLISKPSDAISTIFKDLLRTNSWTPTPEDILIDSNTGIKCYEPYQQYILFDISGIEFTSIGLGLLQSISNDTIGLNITSPRYWSFIFGDKTIIGTNYDNDMLYDQYWVIDLKDIQFINEGTMNEPFYNINPLYFMLDTKPSINKIRMNQIYFGRPEQYIVNTSLFRFGGKFSNEKSTFTTWTWIGSLDNQIYNDGSPDPNLLDNQTFKIGQYAQIACKSAINYDYLSNTYSYYLSSIKPTSDDDKCYGTAGRYGITSTISITKCVIDNNIYYPPMAWRLDSNQDNRFYSILEIEYCAQNISNIYNFNQCTSINIKQCDGPDRIGGSGYVQCDSSEPGGASDDAPYSFECLLNNITQINTAYPTPSPTDKPTVSPITFEPTLAPYTPGTPSRAPNSNSPSIVPSMVPTGITNNPSIPPTSATTIPSNSPTTTTTTNASDDDDDIIKISDWEFGWVEIILFLIILCICSCICLLFWLLKKNRNKKSEKQESSDINNNNDDDDDDQNDNDNHQFGQTAQYQSTRHSIHSNYNTNGVEMERQHKTSYNV